MSISEHAANADEMNPTNTTERTEGTCLYFVSPEELESHEVHRAVKCTKCGVERGVHRYGPLPLPTERPQIPPPFLFTAKHVAQMQETIDRLKDSLSTAHTCLTNNDNALSLAVEQRDALKAELERAREARKQQEATLCAALAVYEEQVQQLEAELSAVREEVANYQHYVGAQMLMSDFRTADDMRAALSAANARAEKAQGEEYFVVAAERDALRAEVATLKGERDEALLTVAARDNTILVQAQVTGRWSQDYEKILAERDELKRRMGECDLEAAERAFKSGANAANDCGTYCEEWLDDLWSKSHLYRDLTQGTGEKGDDQ
jgi:hypothetical protein